MVTKWGRVGGNQPVKLGLPIASVSVLLPSSKRWTNQAKLSRHMVIVWSLDILLLVLICTLSFSSSGSPISLNAFIREGFGLCPHSSIVTQCTVSGGNFFVHRTGSASSVSILVRAK